MNNELTPRDLQLISDYLDNGLSTKDKVRLEARLLREPLLRTELESLQRTRAMLRSLPRRRAPRNFILTPAMVPRRPSFTLFPGFRLASALAGVLLVVSLVGDFLLGGFGIRVMTLAQSSRNLAPAAAPAQENLTAQQKPAGALEPTAAPLIVWGAPKSNLPGVGGGGGGGPEIAGQPVIQPPYVSGPVLEKGAFTPTEPSAEAAQPLATALPDLSPTPTPEQSSILGLPSPTPESSPTPEPTQTEEPTPTPSATPLPTGTIVPTATFPKRAAISQATEPSTGPILGIQPTSEEAVPSAADQLVTSQAAEQQAPRLPVLHLVEALLALTTVGCGAAAFYFYRKEH